MRVLFMAVQLSACDVNSCDVLTIVSFKTKLFLFINYWPSLTFAVSR